MILTRTLGPFEPTLRNGELMRRLAISAPVATTISASIATTAARAAVAAKAARIAATSTAAPLARSLVLPLPRESVCADIAKGRFHRVGLRTSS